MKRKTLKPITSSKKIFVIRHDEKGWENENKLDLFSEFIEDIKNFAIGPYFWFIANNKKTTYAHVSSDIDLFTPFKKEDWLAASGDFFLDLFHPEDRPYMLSAFEYSANLFLAMEEGRRKNVVFNFYGRMLNQHNEYRWILLHAPHHLIDANNIIEHSLLVVYDLSHLNISSMPLLSVIDFNHKETQYFKHINQQIKKIEANVPRITKREKEILQLIAEGNKTPDIAQQLFLSYHTVENHKRNLRHKTNTKTSSELIAYTLKYNLLFI